MFNSHLNDDQRNRLSQQDSGKRTWFGDEANVTEPHARASEAEEQLDRSVSLQEDVEGTWGERDVGIRDHAEAIQEFEELRTTLTERRRERSRSRPGSLSRVTSARSQRSSKSRRSAKDLLSRTRSHPTDEEQAVVPVEGLELAETPTDGSEKREDEEDDFDLDGFMKEGHFEKRVEGRSAKKVGVVWKNLNVQGAGATHMFVKTLPDAIIGTFGPDLYRLLCRFLPFLQLKRNVQLRTLLNDFTGVLRDGQMMLVLGQPGSGCTTFLKAIANDRGSYASVTGDVRYGGLTAREQAKKYRGEVNYNPEDDVHFASLTVWQTLRFALMNKTRKRYKDEIPIIINALLKMFGMSHTKDTLVGDAFVRGISGGERKRVSITETLASKSTVVCWDNSTRGLDSSTALDYAKSLRVMTDISGRTTFVTLYQAGEGIYNVMDKVLVIDSGRCVFQGPAEDAKQYFIDLGYFCPDRQTTPDFLTSVTDPAERQFREGWENKTPKTPEDLEAAYKASPFYTKVVQEVENYEAELRETNYADAREFEQTIQEQKSHRTVGAKSVYTVSFFRQVYACTIREFWLIWGDKATLWTKLFIIIANGLIVGSLFFNQSLGTEGAFSRGGSLFFSIAFLGWLQLAELVRAVSGRAVVARHRDYALYRPSAVVISRVLTDLPMLLWQVIIFGVVMYFMCNLDVDVSKFWIYMLFIYITTINITAMYRMFAALSPTIDDAVRFAGIGLNLLIIYTGYVIPKPQLLNKYIWFGWLYWINPISYSFEAVLSNEFGGRTMDCSDRTLVPQGNGVDSANQGCAISGSTTNAQSVSGSDYIGITYNYYRKNLWRNFGVVIAFTVLYILVTVIAAEVFSFTGGGGGALIFKKSRRAKQQLKNANKQGDLESMPSNTVTTPATGESQSSEENLGKDTVEKVESRREPLERAETPEPMEVAGAETVDGERSLSRAATEKESLGTVPTNRTSLSRPKTKEEQALETLARSDRIMTWRNVNYTVPVMGGERKLLNDISGYVKPGKMIALMGASGAGKTTLLNTLSQRQYMGVVSGDMLVDGKPLGLDFQRGTGFCEQMDIHDGTATIREALEFSALLRQDAKIPRQEKLDYVNNVIDLLELNEIEDAIIMSLDVEQRKRLTIGVELAAKPSLLLFLDEPTSGLDSNSAFSIIRFLKKLSDAGQAIICTIHQPSSILVEQFDMILALNPGGNVFYFGTVGENGRDVIKYFSDRGVDCAPGRNVAEFILETAIKGGRGKDGKKIDWNAEWRNSENQQELLREIDHIHAEREKHAQESPNTEKISEFAAPMWLQTTLLTKRVFTQHWRDPSYLYGKLFVSVILGIFNGFTFYNLGDTVQDMQNRMFTAFLIILFPPTIVNAVVPKFYQNLALWMSRELPSRIYGWVPFTTAMVVAEIPISIVGSVIYWLLWYYPTGLPRDSSTAGYVFLMTMLFFLFQASWGQWICAFAPSFTVISNVLPFFFVMFGLFNGVVRPYDMLSVFWRYWMYYVNPSTYWIQGVIAATLKNQTVRCSDSEFARFTPPSGTSCEAYAGSYARQVGGYVQTLGDGVCGFCQYRSGLEYMRTLNVEPSNKWRDFGIFLAFVCSNWALVYFFVWSVRVKHWSFGFGYLLGLAGKGIGLIKGAVGGLFRKKGGKADGPAGTEAEKGAESNNGAA